VIKYVIYGPTMIDDIQLPDGSIAHDIVGGGGPQAAFAAAFWSDEVGLMTRTGTDFPEALEPIIRGGGYDLQGWHRFAHIPTPHTIMAYDEKEIPSESNERWTWRTAFYALINTPIEIPEPYQGAIMAHLVVDKPLDHVVQSWFKAREDRQATISIEPIFDFHHWTNRDEMTALSREGDAITPDWLAASNGAQSQDPLEVMRHWITTGPEMIAIRHGARGSYVWDRQHDEIWHVPICPVTVRDVTGAGNAYGGGMAMGWMETRDARMAGCYGTVSASFLVEHIGIPMMTETTRETAHRRLEKALEQARRL